jgi:hypothetical protein
VVIGISREAYSYEWFVSYDFSFMYEYAHGIGGVFVINPLMADLYQDYTWNGVFRTPFEIKLVILPISYQTIPYLYGEWDGSVFIGTLILENFFIFRLPFDLFNCRVYPNKLTTS